MKDAFKKAKDNNRLTGTAPITCPFFDEIDEIFSMRHTVNLSEVKEVGVSVTKKKTVKKTAERMIPVHCLSQMKILTLRPKNAISTVHL